MLKIQEEAALQKFIDTGSYYKLDAYFHKITGEAPVPLLVSCKKFQEKIVPRL